MSSWKVVLVDGPDDIVMTCDDSDPYEQRRCGQPAVGYVQEGAYRKFLCKSDALGVVLKPTPKRKILRATRGSVLIEGASPVDLVENISQFIFDPDNTLDAEEIRDLILLGGEIERVWIKR